MTQTLPGAAPRRGVLAIDEGTTGTRAGVVLDSGGAHEVFYRPIAVSHPDDLSVEQDPMEIWTATLDVARRAVGAARADGIAVTAVALSTQRATAMLWDRVTGRPLLPAVVWQDRRYAAELTAHEAQWDAVLTARQGRPVGARAPFLWAARQIAAHPEVAAAHLAGGSDAGGGDAHRHAPAGPGQPRDGGTGLGPGHPSGARHLGAAGGVRPEAVPEAPAGARRRGRLRPAPVGTLGRVRRLPPRARSGTLVPQFHDSVAEGAGSREPQ